VNGLSASFSGSTADAAAASSSRLTELSLPSTVVVTSGVFACLPLAFVPPRPERLFRLLLVLRGGRRRPEQASPDLFRLVFFGEEITRVFCRPKTFLLFPLFSFPGSSIRKPLSKKSFPFPSPALAPSAGSLASQKLI